MEYFTTTKFKDIANREISLICSEYSKRRIPIPNSSRYGRYFDCVEKLANASSGEALQRLVDQEGMGIIVTSLKEIGELYGIVRAFENERGNVYSHKLEEVIRGTGIPDENEAKTQPRDILWELNLAAHFKKAGFDTLLAEPDIVVKDKVGDIHIACKRPNSTKNLEKTIKKARRQITKRGHGLFALSIDKLINPPFDILQGKNMQQISGKIDRLLQDFIAKYRDDIVQWVNHRKVIAAIYSLSLIADDHGKSIFTICQKLFVTNLCPPSSPYFLFIAGMEGRFGPIGF